MLALAVIGPLAAACRLELRRADGICLENHLVTEIERNRPAGAKGELIRGVSLSSTMGPGINLDIAALKATAAASAS